MKVRGDIIHPPSPRPSPPGEGESSADLRRCDDISGRRVDGKKSGALLLPQSPHPTGRAVFMEETVIARADALAAADEGVRRGTRGGCAPQFLEIVFIELHRHRAEGAGLDF